jgi:NitT/TauT family transport system substrate-binding protein
VQFPNSGAFGFGVPNRCLPGIALSLLTLFRRCFKIALRLAILCFCVSASAAEQSITVLMPAPPELPAFAPWVLAKHRGYFAAQELKIDLVQMRGGGAEVAKQVGVGNAPFGYAGGDVTLFLRPQGVPVKTVAVIGGHSLLQVAVHADDTSIREPKDLRGKTITAGTFQDAIYYSFLGMMAKVGLSKSDVNIQALGPTGVWQSFANRKADAMISTPDWTALAEAAGAKVRLIMADQYFPGIAAAVLASDKMIGQNPQLVSKVVVPIVRVMKEIMADPDAAVSDFVLAVPSMAEKKDFVAKVIKSYARDVFPGQEHSGEMNPERLKVIRDFYVAEGIITKQMPLEELYTNAFVPK